MWTIRFLYMWVPSFQALALHSTLLLHQRILICSLYKSSGYLPGSSHWLSDHSLLRQPTGMTIFTQFSTDLANASSLTCAMR